MNDTRPILLASDGSPSASDAQREAFDIARLTGAPLVVVAVTHSLLPSMGYTAYGYAEAVTELRHVEHERLVALLESTADTAARKGIDCTTVEADGGIVDEICQIATEHDAQLIVVGSHGWGAARRLLSGSVSTGLVHSAPCPVLVVRPHALEHAAV